MRTQAARALVRRVRGVSGDYSPLDFMSPAGYMAALERMSDAELIEEHRRIERLEVRAMTDDELLAAAEVEQAKLDAEQAKLNTYEEEHDD